MPPRLMREQTAHDAARSPSALGVSRATLYRHLALVAA